jgi:hypothetical protein
MEDNLKEVSSIQIDKPDTIENSYPCVNNKTYIVLCTY